MLSGKHALNLPFGRTRSYIAFTEAKVTPCPNHGGFCGMIPEASLSQVFNRWLRRQRFYCIK